MFIWQLILIQVITFVLIIIFLRLLFYKHLTIALKRLQELHRQNLEKEVTLNKEMERAKQVRQEEIEKGKEEAKKIKDAVREETEKLREQMMEKSKQEAEALLKEASQERDSLKHRLISEVEEIGVELAVGTVREIFSEEARGELQRELTNELIEELRKIEKERLKIDVKKVELTSSYPLSDTQKKAISEIFQDAVGHPIELEEKINTSIISGIILNLGGLILDGSLSNKLRKVIPYLRKGRANSDI